MLLNAHENTKILTALFMALKFNGTFFYDMTTIEMTSLLHELNKGYKRRKYILVWGNWMLLIQVADLSWQKWRYFVLQKDSDHAVLMEIKHSGEAVRLAAKGRCTLPERLFPCSQQYRQYYRLWTLSLAHFQHAIRTHPSPHPHPLVCSTGT